VWRERAAIYPQNRVLEPREVAQEIAFLCGDAAGGVNAEAITVALGGTAQKPHYEPLERAASSVIGSERIRLPVAAKIALHNAGAMGGKPGSPTPPNGMS
jgi:hypothetical protein